MSEEVVKEESALHVYELAQAEFKFGLRDASGTVREYTLRELNGEEREAYLNGIVGKFEVTSGGKSRVKNFTGLQSGLLARCVYDDNDALVPIKIINRWPSSLQSDLYRRAQRMSGMDETAEDTAKND